MSQGRCLTTDLLYGARLRSSEREMKRAHLGTKPNQYQYCNCTRLSLAITYKGSCTFEQFFFKVHIDSPLYCLINGDMQNKKLRWWISDHTINNQNKRELVPKVIYYFSMNKNVRESSMFLAAPSAAIKREYRNSPKTECIHSVMMFRQHAGKQNWSGMGN